MESNNSAVGAAKPARKRKVFGRREALVQGVTIRFELRADGLHVRRKRSRRVRVLEFADLAAAAEGQYLLFGGRGVE